MERYDPSQEVLIVRVMTDTGAVGLAECNHSALPAKAVIDAAGSNLIGAGIGPIIVGRDPEERETLVRELF